MTNSSTFADQHVVVLGGTSGIGREVALQAAAAGAQVTVMGRSTNSTVDGLRHLRADTTDATSLKAAFEQCGTIHHLVITSGAKVGSPKISEISVDDLQLAYGVKLFGAILAVQAALPYLDAHASITLTSGVLSRKISVGGLLKSPLNAAMETLGKNLAKEMAPRRVNVVSPGVIDTELWGEAGAAGRTAVMAKASASLPVGRPGTAQEAAQLYLLAMQNGFINGTVLDVEGGGLL
jgi:NAD(P)-dependent dehydrogenase (short-subunit alcohol dehydrogenase family)